MKELKIVRNNLNILMLILFIELLPWMALSVHHIENDFNYHDIQQQQQKQKQQRQQQFQISSRVYSPLTLDSELSQKQKQKQSKKNDTESPQWRRRNKQQEPHGHHHHQRQQPQQPSQPNHQKHYQLKQQRQNDNNFNYRSKLSMSLTKFYSAEATYADDEEEFDQMDRNYHSIEDISDFDGDNDDAIDSSLVDNNGKKHSHHPPYDFYSCCKEVFGSCRTACENLSLGQLTGTGSNGRGIRLELKKFCPSMQLEFWSCMNQTLEAVIRGSQWSGRRCCGLGVSPRCSNACATSLSTGELISVCRQSDEQHMFACFERQEAGDRCCSNARTSECLQACRSIFEQQVSRKRNYRRYLQEMCNEKNGDVLLCIKNVTDMTPVTNSHKYVPCCNFSDNINCRNTCRNVLNTTESTDLIIGEMEAGGCGMVMPHLPLWQCFFTAERNMFVPATILGNNQRDKTDVSQINQLGIDGAKLHCCEKSLNTKCRRLCLQTYTTDWITTMNTFENTCLNQPNELHLRQCIEEVDEPCELGCDGLSFCTNFNNRPTELFRSCNHEADAAAKSDLLIWQHRGYVSLPGVHLPIKNMTRCSPNKWKAIACVLQIKPCTHHGHYNHICRDNCFDILSECIDWTRMNTSLNADNICGRLHPEGEGIPCLSLRPYLEESDVPKETGGHHKITSPCKGDPCNASEVCLASRNGTASYQCVPSCALGETSNFLIPFGNYVRIPVQLSESRGGFKVCRCGLQGRIEHCQPLPGVSYENCILPGGRKIKHGTSFYLECNLCTCYAEEITCTKKQCRFPGYTDMSYTSLPCNCPTHYVPVCGSNGRTYPSLCIARCLGLQDSDLEYGACSIWNPCTLGSYQCPTGTECLEYRQICLSSMHKPCLQYRCVNLTQPCEKNQSPETVCDLKGVTYELPCKLFTEKRSFGYWGPCRSGCSWKGPVCGINGANYKHECAAWADFVLVDYRGRCREVGLLTNEMGRHRCRLVRCSNLPSPYCRHIIPPGACCPICAGAFRIIYSRKQIDRALYALRGQHKDLLTLHSVLRELDALIQITECQLTGFLTMEVGIFIGIVPISDQPTRMQIEACIREAEKISALISTQSHRITTNLILSGLTQSIMLDTHVDSKANHIGYSTNYKITVIYLTFSFVIGHIVLL